MNFVDAFYDLELGVFYWLFIPIIIVYHIFTVNTPDPLGKYGLLVESGEYTYNENELIRYVTKEKNRYV